MQHGWDIDAGSLHYEQIGTAAEPVGTAKYRYRKWVHANFVEGEYGTLAANMSYRDFYLDAWYSQTDGCLVNSYQDHLNIMLSRISDVNQLYSSKVTNIKTSTPPSVTYLNGQTPTTLNVDYIISTLPITILQRGTVAFNPALSSAFVNSANKLGMGVLEKVLLVFNVKFWRPAVPANAGYIYWLSDNYSEYPYAVLYDTWDPGHTALEFFMGANWAIHDVTYSTDAQVQTRMRQILTKMFPATFNATVSIVNMVRSNWTNDPWAYGSYSYQGIGYDLSTDYNNLLATTGRLYWAGEHTRKDFISTVHGAVYSGQDAANNVCKALGGCSSLVRHPDMIYP